MLILVTGGAGFIGSHVAEKLVSQGISVRVLDNFSSGRHDNILPLGNKIDVVRGNVFHDRAITKSALCGVDAVVHLAAVASVARSVAEPTPVAFDNGIGATFALLEDARAMGVRRFVYASSAAVYGNTAAIPTPEHIPSDPLSPYAASKACGEAILRSYCASYDMETISLRFFNVFGPRQDPSSSYSGVISLFCRAAAVGEPISIYGDGEQTRDFVYVEDVADAATLAATRGCGEYCAVNVGSGRPCSVNELVRTIEKVIGRELEKKYLLGRPAEVKESLADASLAKSLLGWQAETSTEEGVRRILEWYSTRTSSPWKS